MSVNAWLSYGSQESGYWHSAFAGFYLLAKVEEAADKPIYKWMHHSVSGHTLKHLCAAMVPVFLTLMLAKRNAESERFAFLTCTVWAHRHPYKEQILIYVCLCHALLWWYHFQQTYWTSIHLVFGEWTTLTVRFLCWTVL